MYTCVPIFDVFIGLNYFTEYKCVSESQNVEQAHFSTPTNSCRIVFVWILSEFCFAYSGHNVLI